MKDSDNVDWEKQYFLKELETLSNYRTSFSTSRLVIVGGAMSAIGIIVPLTQEIKFPHIILVQLIVWAIIFVTVRMIASYSYAIYIFFNQIEKIEKILNVNGGFSEIWHNGIKDGKDNSATYACFVVSSAISILGHVFIISSGVFLLYNIKPQPACINMFYSIYLLVPLVSAVMFQIYMYKNLLPRNIYKIIKNSE